MSQLTEKVEEISGEDGWWKSSSRETFQRAAQDLVDHHFTEEEAIDMLTELYWATARCYGGHNR